MRPEPRWVQGSPATESGGPGGRTSNSKHQITNPKQIPISQKAMTETFLFGIWPLEIIWCLEFGASMRLRFGYCDFEGNGV